MNPIIGIVTVLFNSESVISDFFMSLNKQTYRDFILYVIDNKSPDNALTFTRQLLKRVSFRTVVIENSENYGIAKGNNIGIRKALEDGCGMVLLSNNDVTMEKDTIEALLKGMELHKASMAAPKIYHYGTNLLWSAGGYFQKRSGQNIHRGYGKADKGQYQEAEQITFSPTCFMLLMKGVFERIGLMDENYFVYWDDTDFVFRAITNHEALWYIPESVIHHKEATSTGVLSDFSIRYHYRNLVYFALKNYIQPYAFYVIAFNMAYHCYKHAFRWPFAKLRLGLVSFREGIIYFRAHGSI